MCLFYLSVYGCGQIIQVNDFVWFSLCLDPGGALYCLIDGRHMAGLNDGLSQKRWTINKNGRPWTTMDLAAIVSPRSHLHAVLTVAITGEAR